MPADCPFTALSAQLPPHLPTPARTTSLFSRWIGHRLPIRTRGTHPYARTFGTCSAFPHTDSGHRVQKQKEKTQTRKKSHTQRRRAHSQEKKTDPLDLIHLILRPALGLLASLPRTFSLKKLRIIGRLGFADPAKTGIVSSYLRAIKSLKNKFILMNIDPDFTRPGAFGQLDLVAHFHLGLLLFFLGRFGLQVGFRFLASRLLGWKLYLI